MEKELIYRQATIADIEQIREVSLKAYGQYNEILSEENWATMKANLGDTSLYRNLLKIAQCFVCETKKQLAGIVFLVPSGNPTNIFEKDWSYIRLLGVDPAFEGNGIGRKLTQMCIDHARKNGENIIALHTSEYQNAARHIYESLGFIRQKELDRIYGKRYFLYIMHLNNSASEITYHKATIDDVETLVENRIKFALELSGEQPQDFLDKLKTQMRDYFTRASLDNSCISFIAKSGAKIAGIGSVHIRELPGNFKNPSGKWGYIMNMYTIPEFRRKGICSRILTKLTEAAAEIGITALELHATTGGEFVYQKMGFKIHHEPTYRLYL